MKEIKQTMVSTQAIPVERPAAERNIEESEGSKKKVAAGRAGAAARQKRPLEQL